MLLRLGSISIQPPCLVPRTTSSSARRQAAAPAPAALCCQRSAYPLEIGLRESLAHADPQIEGRQGSTEQSRRRQVGRRPQLNNERPAGPSARWLHCDDASVRSLHCQVSSLARSLKLRSQSSVSCSPGPSAPSSVLSSSIDRSGSAARPPAPRLSVWQARTTLEQRPAAAFWTPGRAASPAAASETGEQRGDERQAETAARQPAAAGPLLRPPLRRSTAGPASPVRCEQRQTRPCMAHGRREQR